MATALKSQLSFQMALATLPTLYLYAATLPKVLAQVKSILEEFYTDGIDQVLSAQLDASGDIVGEFSDQVGARQVKRYKYQITDNEVTYKLLNPTEVASFTFESYKPLFGKGSRAGQKKHCRISTPCGDSCIAAGKVCRKKPGSAVKAKIAEVKKELGGAISTVPKKSKAEELPPLGTAGRAQAIDEKYAKKAPTDADASAWLKERIENDNHPSDKNILDEAIVHARMSPVFDLFDDASSQYSSTVKDRESFAQAAYAYEQKRSKIAKAQNLDDDETNPKYWEAVLWNASDEAKLKSAEKRRASGKTEESRKKAAQEYERLKQDKSDVKERAQDMASEALKTKSKPKDIRLEEFRAEFDDEYKRAAQRIKKTSKELKQGNPAATSKATEKLKRQLGIDSTLHNPYAGMSDVETARSVMRDGFKRQTRQKLDDIPAAKMYLREVAGYSPDIPEGWDLKKGFSSTDIKRQYRSLALKHHPDAGGSPEKFRALTDEYEKLMTIADRRKNGQ